MSIVSSGHYLYNYSLACALTDLFCPSRFPLLPLLNRCFNRKSSTLRNGFTEIKYIIYKLDNPSKPTKIVVGNSSESQEYDDFLEQFTDTECCYAVYDFQYNQGEGERNKICFFIW